MGAIPTKRVAPPETHFPEREEVSALLHHVAKEEIHRLQGEIRELERRLYGRKSESLVTSLVNYWAGLTVFVDHPEVAMDNNEAER